MAVGNALGAYKLPPKLDSERIAAIAERTGIPLVLRGGSGLSDEDFQLAVWMGICKINIFIDIDRAGKHGIEGIAAGVGSMLELIPYEMAEIGEAVREKIALFGFENRA